MQPHVESFKDCFDLCEPFDLFGKKVHPFGPRYVKGASLGATLWALSEHLRGAAKHPGGVVECQNAIGPFCSVETKQGNRYFSVSCADWVLSRLAESRGLVPCQTAMSFEVIDHGNGWSLVLAKQGGYTPFWLAYIKTETIPG